MNFNGIGGTYCTRQEILCVPYAIFFLFKFIFLLLSSNEVTIKEHFLWLTQNCPVSTAPLNCYTCSTPQGFRNIAEWTLFINTNKQKIASLTGDYNGAHKTPVDPLNSFRSLNSPYFQNTGRLPNFNAAHENQPGPLNSVLSSFYHHKV